MARFTHDTTVTVIVGDEGGEDSIDFDVRLYVTNEGGDLALERFDIAKLVPPSMGEPSGRVYVAPFPACYPDANDQGVIDAVDTWWADHADECLASARAGEARQ